jgi:HEPN domain-containing protein
MGGPSEETKGRGWGTLGGEEWQTAGGDFLRGLRELAAECASVIEWNEELVQKNKELVLQLETLQSRYENLSEEIHGAVSKELANLLREFEHRALTLVRQVVEGILQRGGQ